MAAAPVGVDREAEAERRALDLVDDALRPDVQELEAAVLAPARLALEDRFVEEGLLGAGLVGLVPPQGGHVQTLANVRMGAYARTGAPSGRAAERARQPSAAGGARMAARASRAAAIGWVDCWPLA